jgi:site-specific recombinase XerD
MAEHHIVELLRKVARRANLKINGPHILRHTFCSHLAMSGARQRERFRSLQVIVISRRHSATCT